LHWLVALVGLAWLHAPAEAAEGFDVAPNKMLRLASKAPEGVDAFTISRTSRYDIDDEGRMTTSHHTVAVVLSEEALENWTSVGVEWRPELEARPELRARVVTPDGEEHLLDPSRFQEAVQKNDDPSLLQDTREIWAPLPQVVRGAVIEYESVHRDVTSSRSSGRLVSVPVYGHETIGERRVEVRAPVSSPLNVAVRGTEGREDTFEVKERRAGKRRIVEVTVTSETPAYEAPPEALPHGSPTHPFVLIGTGRSWKQVSRDYSRLTDEAASTAGLDEAIREVRAAKSARDKVEVATRIARDDVRYTGVEFGMQRIVPHAPGDVLKLGYGDCKDKALLIVSLLGAAGIEAHPALLWAGYGPGDADPDFPSLDWFNHAIVHVPGLDLWIDPTSRFSPVGKLPGSDQGRWALPISARGEDLVRTPFTGGLYRESRVFELSVPGRGSVSEETYAEGDSALGLHRQFSAVARGRVQEMVEDYAQKAYGSPWGTATFGPAEAGPFTMRLEASPRHSQSVIGHAWVEIGLRPLVSSLPGFFNVRPGSAEDPLASRTAPIEVLPVRVELEDIVKLPRGFEVQGDLEPRRWTAGDASLELRQSAGDDAALRRQTTLDIGDGRFEVEEAKKLRQALFEVSRTASVRASHPTAAALERDEVATAWTELRQAVPREKDQLAHEWVLEGNVRWSAGFEEEAIEAFRQAERVRPDDPLVLQALGRAQALRGDPAAAKTLRRAWLADQDFAPVQLARLLFFEGRFEELADLAEQYDARDLDWPAGFQELALAGRLLSGDLDGVAALELPEDYVPIAIAVARMMKGQPLDSLSEEVTRGSALLMTLVALFEPELREKVPGDPTEWFAMVDRTAAAGDPGRTPESPVEAVASLMRAIVSGRTDDVPKDVRDVVRTEDLFRAFDSFEGPLPATREFAAMLLAEMVTDKARFAGSEDAGWFVQLDDPPAQTTTRFYVEKRRGTFEVTAVGNDAVAIVARDLDKALARDRDDDLPDILEKLAVIIDVDGVDELPDSADERWLWARYFLGADRGDHDRLAALPSELVGSGLSVCGRDLRCRLAVLEPHGDDIFPSARVAALVEAGRREEAEALAKRVDDIDVDITLAIALGRYDALEELVEGEPELLKRVANEAVWGLLVEDRVDDAAEWAEHLEADSAASLHTRACYELLSDDLDAAMRTWREARGRSVDLGPEWGFVEGGLARHLGLQARARAAYGRVERNHRPNGTWRLLDNAR